MKASVPVVSVYKGASPPIDMATYLVHGEYGQSRLAEAESAERGRGSSGHSRLWILNVHRASHRVMPFHLLPCL